MELLKGLTPESVYYQHYLLQRVLPAFYLEEHGDKGRKTTEIRKNLNVIGFQCLKLSRGCGSGGTLLLAQLPQLLGADGEGDKQAGIWI